MINYPLLEVTAEVMLGDVPALIVYGPATQAVVRDRADLARWFADCRREVEPRLTVRLWSENPGTTCQAVQDGDLRQPGLPW